jgi:hypothetical protein
MDEKQEDFNLRDGLSPFEIPDLFSIFIQLLIESPIDILYLGAINKR